VSEAAILWGLIASPRRTLADVRRRPQWRGAAIAATVLAAISTALTAASQLHLLALTNARRVAAAPPGERPLMRLALAQAQPHAGLLLFAGALGGLWLLWLGGAIFFAVVAAAAGRRTTFRLAWTAMVDSYVPYAVANLANAVLVALRGPAAARTPLDLFAIPSLGTLVTTIAPEQIKLAAFGAAFNPLSVWYFIVVGYALALVLELPAWAAAGAAVIYAVIIGLLIAATA
jgi:hypothetical protein